MTILFSCDMLSLCGGLLTHVKQTIGLYLNWLWLSLQMHIYVICRSELTHWGRDKMDAISQTTLSNAFLWMKMLEFWLKFHWSLFLRVQLTIFHHWFRQWLGAVQVTGHYLNQWWFVYRRIYASLGLNELMSFYRMHIIKALLLMIPQFVPLAVFP